MLNSAALHLALRNRLLTVSGLPTARAWTNVDFVPTAGAAYLEEAFAPATARLRTVNARNGISEATGFYVVRWYGLENTDAMAIEAGADAILAKFSPGTAMTLTGGDVVVIRGDVAPTVGQVTPLGDGWAVAVITIPWRITTRNVVAA